MPYRRLIRRLITKINADIRLPNLKKINLMTYHYYSDFCTLSHVSFVIKKWDKQSNLPRLGELDNEYCLAQ